MSALQYNVPSAETSLNCATVQGIPSYGLGSAALVLVLVTTVSAAIAASGSIASLVVVTDLAERLRDGLGVGAVDGAVELDAADVVGVSGSSRVNANMPITPSATTTIAEAAARARPTLDRLGSVVGAADSPVSFDVVEPVFPLERTVVAETVCAKVG